MSNTLKAAGLFSAYCFFSPGTKLEK